jgi:hypothetical protein
MSNLCCYSSSIFLSKCERIESNRARKRSHREFEFFIWIKVVHSNHSRITLNTKTHKPSEARDINDQAMNSSVGSFRVLANNTGVQRTQK